MKPESRAVILIVDDKPSNILSLEAILSHRDRQLLSATSGSEALHISLNQSVDLIIMDVQMPGMDGFEVAQILKSNKRTKDIPIIFATAENKEHRSIIQGYDEGAIDYLFKPLDPQIVQAKVNVLLKLQLQKRELQEMNDSLSKCALLIDNSADILGIIDIRTFRIEEVNRAFTNILGYERDEIIGSSLHLFLSNEDREKLPFLKQDKNDRLSFETRVYCKDRTIKWLHWNVVVKYGKWFINVRDITEIKEVERIRNYLGTVVKQSNDAIYIHDNEGRIISWNNGAQNIYGYTEEEALHMKIWNIIPEYMQSETGEIVGQVIRGKKIENLETRRITKQGKLVDVLFSASVIEESNDKGPSIAITERDITRQKIAEEKLRENERFLSSVLDTMSEAVIVTDIMGKAILMNPAASSLLGKHLKEVNINNWYTSAGFYHPDGHEQIKMELFPLVEVLSGKESSQRELCIKNKFVPNGISVIASSTPLKNSHSEITGAIFVILDISERIKTEKALKESEIRFRNLFEYAPYPMWVYDMETMEFLEVNKPAIQHYGFSKEEFLSMKITDIRPLEHVNELIKTLKADKPVDFATEWVHQLKNGQLIDVEITAHHIDFKGRRASLVIAKDITEQKRNQARIRELNKELLNNVKQLEDANKELESFSYSVSHDLRAPLRGLNGYSTMLQEDYAHVLDDEAKRLLGRIQHNAYRMGMLIDDLLNLSRLGRKEIQKTEIDMEQLVVDIINELNINSPNKAAIKIEKLAPSEADQSLIRQVWTNLISNAIKYSGKKENPKIEIGSVAADDAITYHVKDNGTGFNMKYADKLFGVFQRLHNRDDFEGTGIGLAIVQRIISKHGGSVWVDAKENEGASFYFSLPANKNKVEDNEQDY